MQRNVNNIYTVFPWNGEGSPTEWFKSAGHVIRYALSSSTTLSTCLIVLVGPVFKCLAHFFFLIAKWLPSYQLEFWTMLSFLWIYLLAFVSLTLKSPIRGEDYWAFILKTLSLSEGMMEFCNLWTKFCEVTIQMKPPCPYFHMMLFVFSAFQKTKFRNSCRILPHLAAKG